MGMLDNIKDALSKDDAERAEDAKEAADEAKQQADEAQRKADEAAAEADGSGEAVEVDEGAKGVNKVEKTTAKPVQKKKPAPKPKKTVYTVKSGDTLSAIGAKYGVDWRDIARVNKIPNPDLIYPGQKFVIPGK